MYYPGLPCTLYYPRLPCTTLDYPALPPRLPYLTPYSSLHQPTFTGTPSLVYDTALPVTYLLCVRQIGPIPLDLKTTLADMFDPTDLFNVDFSINHQVHGILCATKPSGFGMQ